MGFTLWFHQTWLAGKSHENGVFWLRKASISGGISIACLMKRAGGRRKRLRHGFHQKRLAFSRNADSTTSTPRIQGAKRVIFIRKNTHQVFFSDWTNESLDLYRPLAKISLLITWGTKSHQRNCLKRGHARILRLKIWCSVIFPIKQAIFWHPQEFGETPTKLLPYPSAVPFLWLFFQVINCQCSG